MRVFTSVVLLMTSLPVSSGFMDGLFGHGGLHSNPDVFCIMEHCGHQSAACMGDPSCRSNMECMTKCGMTNHSCMYECMNTYEDAIFDAFMKCLVDDYHCLNLTPPDPTYRCKPPSTSVKNVSLADLQGTWNIVLGLNRDYDCFDCQISTYKPTSNSNNYTLTELYDVTMLNGTVRHRVDVQQVAQHISPTGSYVIMYYCGHMTSDWWYEGNVVYSRLPVLTSGDALTVSAALSRLMGHDVSEYCRPKTQTCGNQT
ncbi:VDE-like protein [Mya arenaria]|uniref:VDE-like protein n=1 Tax=Mya arenaria TaxID=6604 RepID=A0ABY7FNT8_MYAAR|nr:VDE-like protein [Mya arenaria]